MHIDNYLLSAAAVTAISAGKLTQYMIMVIIIVIIIINLYEMENPQHISRVTPDP